MVQEIPSGQTVYNIITDRDAGMSFRQICIKYGVSQVTARNYVDGVSRSDILKGWIAKHDGKMPRRTNDPTKLATSATSSEYPPLSEDEQMWIYNDIRQGIDPQIIARRRSVPIFVVEGVRDGEYAVKLATWREWLHNGKPRSPNGKE